MKLFIILLYLGIADTIFFSLIKNFLHNQIKIVQKKEINLNIYSALLAYILISVGIYYYGIIKQFTIYEMFFLGIFTYGIFELTNYSIFDNWKPEMVIIDTLWGGILFSSCIYLVKQLNINI